MFPIRLERDTNLVDWTSGFPGWCTDHNIITANNQVRSDGVLHSDYAIIDFNGAQGMAARKATFAGVHLAAPLEEEGFTCYQITARMQCDEPTVRPILVVGEAQTVTADAGGDQIKHTSLLDVALYSGLEGAALRTDMTIALPPMEEDGTNPCFAVGLLAGDASSVTENGWFHLAVRRLVGVNPKILDTTKLG